MDVAIRSRNLDTSNHNNASRGIHYCPILFRGVSTFSILSSRIWLIDSAAALHSFILPTPESESSPTIKSFETTYPILDYSLLPNSSDTYLLTLDTTFGPINSNQLTGQMPKPKPKDFEVTEEQRVEMEKCYRIVKVASDGTVSRQLVLS
jgi:hypothetical protein